MEQISSILYSLFRDSPQHGDWIVACLQGAWPGLVGEKLAEVCRPVSFRRPQLVVEILDERWYESLKSMLGELLKRIRLATGNEVESLSLRKK